LFSALTALGCAALLAPGLVLQCAPPCLFDFAGFEHCWGCGMTHAALACLHGQFGLARDANPRVFIVLPLILMEYLRFGWRLYGAQWRTPVALMP
jgi:hypothetical protein